MAFYEYPTNVSGFSGLMEWNNTVTGGLFAIMILGMIGLIAFVATGNQRKEVSFAFAGFVLVVSSVFMAAMGLVGGHVIVICAIISAATAANLFMKP